jgi:hypothetical protein
MTDWNGQNEEYEPELARLAAALALDTARVSALQFSEVQTGGVALV